VLKSKKLIKIIVILIVSLSGSVIAFWSLRGSVWTRLDFQALDFFFWQAVKSHRGVAPSSLIVYLNITDETYRYFGKNILDRVDLSKVNVALAELGVEAVAYDIIFPRPSNFTSDRLFAESLTNLACVYLPIGFELAEKALFFKWETGTAYERLRSNFLRKPLEKGTPKPLHALRAAMQLDDFFLGARGSGDISAISDPDGVYRHLAMLVKVDSLYFPTLALAMFLDYAQMPFEKIVVDWGREIRIPATQENTLEQEVIIPIDERGRTFIPYPQVWGQDFQQMPAHKLLQLQADENLAGNLAEFFEGKFVFIGDIAVGTSDLGQTPLEDRAPLVAIHAASMNGLLTNTFYRPWPFLKTIGLIALIGIFLAFAALPRAVWIVYLAGGVILAGIIGLTWIEQIRFSLFPIVSVGSSFLFIFFGLIVGPQIAIAKEQAFIRNAFSKYVPERVVNELLVHPELLQLGGEERMLSVLFSDIAGFTSIAEKMSPTELVSLLNEYLTEMTSTILAEGGIIDKYLGDAIMAEFGAPIPAPNHADMAVRAGLKMQRRLRELRDIWKSKGLPELRCRIGINTGPMVVGNMGSQQAFDYTVIGDAVNLASRLENANKLYGTSLMVSEFTHAQLSPNTFSTRLLDIIKVKGKTQAIKVYEVYGEATDSVDSRDGFYYQIYYEAFTAYLLRQFSTAQEKFELALSLRPNDPAAQNMLARIDSLHPADLPDDWDGTVKLDSK